MRRTLLHFEHIKKHQNTKREKQKEQGFFVFLFVPRGTRVFLDLLFSLSFFRVASLSICTGAPAAATVNALLERDLLALTLTLPTRLLLQLCTRYPADAHTTTMIVTTPDTLQTAELLVPASFPLRDQQLVRVPFPQQPQVQFPRDKTSLEIESVHVTRSLVLDLYDLPQLLRGQLRDFGAGLTAVLDVQETRFEVIQCGLDLVETLWWW